ncbi:hypothetical protein [Paracoccus denitrificans]|uniref:hypothetical protein n=1 Tax=Paracoccus denitrificans TaxID=266 RepID=UPI001E4FBB9B|nr:hypothetical protein [Paracoccus denitrificans]UFS63843.1 hypothetical protein LO749_06530 [Paracoccus denitrificans]
MFTFTDQYQFEWPVRVKMPAGGEDQVFEFDGIFLLPEDEMEIFEAQPAAQGVGDFVTFSRERLAKYWIGWKGIAVEGGGDLPFSPAARDKLLKKRPIRLAVDAALTEAVLGIREKN